LQNARIILDDSEVILHSADSIASVGILHPLVFHLDYKADSSERNGNSAAAEENSCCLYEVDEGIAHTDVEENQTFSPVTAVDACTNTDLWISKTGKNLRSIGCWIQDSTKASQGA
jgi:diphthine-ammonia ligase